MVDIVRVDVPGPKPLPDKLLSPAERIRQLVSPLDVLRRLSPGHLIDDVNPECHPTM